MKRFISPLNLVYFVLVSFVANAYILVDVSAWFLLLVVPIFLYLNLFAGVLTSETKRLRLRICYHGGVLLGAFALSLLVSVFYHAILLIFTYDSDIWLFIISVIWCVFVSAYVFWNGIFCVYLTSKHLGIKWRVLGALCGVVPVVNIITLGIVHTAQK